MHSPQDTPIMGKDNIQLGSEFFITDWLSRHNHTENKDAEIHSMDIKIDTIQTTMKIPECRSIPQIQQVTAQDDHLE